MDYDKHFEVLLKNWRSADTALIERYAKKYATIDELCETGPTIFYLFNYHTLNFEYLSDGFSALTGYSPVVFQKNSKPFFDLIEVEDQKILAETVYPTFQEIRSTHDKEDIKNLAFQVTFRLVKKNGQVIRVLQQFHVLEVDDDHHPLLSFGRVTELSMQYDFGNVSAAVHSLKDQEFRLIYQKTIDDSSVNLTLREKEVVIMLTDGKTSRQIGLELHISPNTVNRHKQNIMDKLGFDSTAELVKYAVLHGIYKK
ncbi:LuxR C-terminal-related transcriptional regulator [Ekhidna sp.]|uniref:LuxR C-terminal-related transcriptional regulator n=1 Tax=Ekhidna sp. TaxID=2608089 RepID=UPI0032EB8B80